MLNATIIIVALLLAGYLAFSKKLAGSSNWKATVTPLASIMGRQRTAVGRHSWQPGGDLHGEFQQSKL